MSTKNGPIAVTVTKKKKKDLVAMTHLGLHCFVYSTPSVHAESLSKMEWGCFSTKGMIFEVAFSDLG